MRLLSGSSLEGLSLKSWRGRFSEEHNAVVYTQGRRACSLKIFCGRGPYRAWVEIFDIDAEIFKTAEKRIYDEVALSLAGGESLFVEYFWDPESVRAADLGLPPHLTRIGMELVARGFTWLKLWYFPEGHMEGGQKIQAQKPIDENQRRRNIAEACREIASLGRLEGDLESRRRRLMEIMRCGEIAP